MENNTMYIHFTDYICIFDKQYSVLLDSIFKYNPTSFEFTRSNYSGSLKTYICLYDGLAKELLECVTLEHNKEFKSIPTKKQIINRLFFPKMTGTYLLKLIQALHILRNTINSSDLFKSHLTLINYFIQKNEYVTRFTK